mgnify:CR=1 FL=1
MNLSIYNSIIFDCDGVILNSNKIKTEGFRITTKNFKREDTELLIKFHLLNGGISRFKKFEYFLDKILPSDPSRKRNLLLEEFLDKYQSYTQQEMLNSEVTSELNSLRLNTKNKKWFIVSGGEQNQLESIFKYKKIDHLFDGGIYGSPKDKDQIFKEEISKGNLVLPSLYLGDSKYDHIVSNLNGLDFIFVYEWTEFKEYEKYCNKFDIQKIGSINYLKNFF